MRLTLRTLLAYLDDILEPADARELGNKISESSVAAGMVERIRDVMRKRRITAPELTGPGSGPDPNLVAEYLDNTLAPDAVTEIERLCLESDIHLAEAAGCHQILTIVLGEPVDLSARTRERMYALGAIAPPEGQNGGTTRREPVPPAMADTRRTAAVAAATVQSGDETFAQGLPDYLRRRPLWKRLLPVAAALALLAWLAFAVYDLRGTFLPGSPAETTAAAPAPEIDVAPAAPAVVAAAPTVSGPDESTTEPGQLDADKSIAIANESINPEPPADLVEPTAKPDAELAVVPAPPAAELATGSEPATVDEPAPPAVVENGPPINYTSIDGLALRYDQETNDWFVLERQSSVALREWIAAPDPFASRLDVAGGQMVIVINPETVIQSIAPWDGCLTSLYVDRGRVVLSRPSGDQASPDPIRVGVQVGRQQLEVELLEPGTLVGIDVLLQQPQGIPTPWEEPGIGGGIYVVAGAATVLPLNEEQVVLSPENGYLAWPATDGVWQPGSLLSHPNWVTPNGLAVTAYARMYEKLFPLDQSVAVGVPAIVRDGRAKISQYAVETLGLTRNTAQLLRALQADHDEARQSAIVELRQWLPRSPENADILREELGRYFRDDEVDALNELLWGYSAQNLRDFEISTRLVDWLNHDDVAVRELAVYHIKTGTNRPTDYHPLAPIVQRQAAIARLNEVIRRQGGLLPPDDQQSE